MARAYLRLNEVISNIVNETISTNNIINIMGTSIPLSDKYIGGNKYTFISKYDLLTGAYPPHYTITDEQPEAIEISTVKMLIPNLTSNEYEYVESLYNQEFPIYPGDIFILNDFPYVTRLNANDDSNINNSPIGFSAEDLDPVALSTTESNIYKIKFRYIYKLENFTYGDKFHYLYIYLNSINPPTGFPPPPNPFISNFNTNVVPDSITEIGNNLIKDSNWKYYIDGFESINNTPNSETGSTLNQVQQIRFKSIAGTIYPEFELPYENIDMFTKIYFFRKDYPNIYTAPEVIDDRLTYFGKPIIEGQSIPYRAVKEGRVLFNTTQDNTNLPTLFIGFDLISGGLIQLYETQITN